MKKTTISIEVLRMTKWNFEKAEKLQKIKDKLTYEEFNYYQELSAISNEIAVGKVNQQRLEKIKKLYNFLNKNKKQCLVLGCVTVLVLVNSAMVYAGATMCSSFACVGSCKVASLAAPSLSMVQVTNVMNQLINNLIRFGVLATIASCVFEMSKGIVEGNITKMPKILISHGMMMCCLLVSPTIFSKISEVFGMGGVLGMTQVKEVCKVFTNTLL